MKYKEKLELAAPPNGSYCLLQKNQVFEDPLTAMRVLVMVSNSCRSGTDKLSLRLFYKPKTDIFQTDIT